MPLFDYLETHPFGVLDADATPVSVGAPYQWLQGITALRTGSTALEAVTTTNLDLGSRVDIYIDGVLEAWFLTTGAADGTDLNGQVAPLDYNVTTNPKHWVKGL